MTNRVYLLLGLSLVSLLLFSGCQYHWGSGRPEGLYGLEMGSVTNQTMESSLTAAFRQAAQEQIGTDPGLHGGFVTHQLNVKLETLQQKNIARAELRDRTSRAEDGAAYQTVLYRLELRAHYTVSSLADPSGQSVLAGTVIGRADIPRMHDLNVPYQAACRQAADDAARQIIAAVVESARLKP
jgi:hypothetical protein